MSIYGAIKHELIYQLQNATQGGTDTPVIEMLVKGQGIVRTGEHVGKPFWNFGMKTALADKLRLAAGREQYFKQLAAAQAGRPQIGEQGKTVETTGTAAS